jgi:hypothetical protein
VRSPTVLAAAALTVGLAAGCAAIPESSPVEVVGPGVVDSIEAPVPGPRDGLDPLDVVRGFVEAAGSQANGHAAARAYLTDAARTAWNDGAPVVVIDELFDTVYATSAGDSSGDTYREVLLRAQQIGQLGEDFAFAANRGTITPLVRLIKEDGQWRISQPPNGLHIRARDFHSSYRSIGVKFVDPSRETLVTDRRWVPTRPSASLPGRAIDLLLGGPSAAVADAVANLLDGAITHTNVVIGENDVLVVDLARVPELSDGQRRLAAAQIVGSLSEAVAHVQRIRIFADGAPLVPSKDEWTPPDAGPFTPQEDVRPELPALAVTGGRIARVGGEGVGVGGPAGDGSLAVESAAQSADGALLALVSRLSGVPRLYVGPVGSPQPVAVDAASMTRPTWRLGAAEAWTVLNGKDGAGVLWTESGELRTFGVDLSELSVKGRITELRLSRDGVRVAAVVDGALFVAIVVGSGAETKVRNPRLLVGPGAPQIADVDWKGEQLVVATLGKDPAVYAVTGDGLGWTAYKNTNLTGPLTGIAAAVGRNVLVADQGGLWSAGDTNALWNSEGYGGGVDPFYPG